MSDNRQALLSAVAGKTIASALLADNSGGRPKGWYSRFSDPLLERVDLTFTDGTSLTLEAAGGYDGEGMVDVRSTP